MGNCGSSLDCTTCYTRYPYKGCETKLKVNADIAGIGVLISFYFSAVAVFVIVLWGYFNECLPSGLTSKTDHDTISLIKSLIKRSDQGSLHGNDTTALSLKRKKQNDGLVRFMQILSDQQLITGLAILIAALSSRCQISLYELRIVTSLAYFSATTHTLSIDLLRDYLRDVPVNYRVFGYNPVNLLILIPILVLLIGKHASAIGRFLDLTIETWHFKIRLRAACPRSPLQLRCQHSSNDASIRPTNSADFNNRKRLRSFLGILETYHEAYLSEIPVWCFQFAYGTKNTIRALRFDDLELSDEARNLGFGQVVAIDLLIIPIFAAVQIVNETQVAHASRPPTDPRVTGQLNRHATATLNEVAPSEESDVHDALDTTVSGANLSSGNFDTAQDSENTTDSTLDLVELAQGSGTEPAVKDASSAPAPSLNLGHSATARTSGISYGVICLLITTILVVTALIDDGIQTYVLIIMMALWSISRVGLAVARIISQIRFVSKKVKIYGRKEGLSQPVSEASSSDSLQVPPAPLVTRTSPLVTADTLCDSGDMSQSTATGACLNFVPPRRIDTEADIGLVSLSRRHSSYL
ncbi:Nn.00g074150.m01.CDS01 [Neocucurbitaria sp. VM-36]